MADRRRRSSTTRRASLRSCRRSATRRAGGRCRCWWRRQSNRCCCRRRRTPRRRPSSSRRRNPCDTSVCVGVGFTPAANRVSMIGMFEIIGSASTILASNVCADETEVVSSSGASRGHGDRLVDPPISSWNGRLICWPTPSDDGARRLLEAFQRHGDLVVAGLQQRRFEVAAAVGGEVLRDAGVGVGDLDRRARQHAAGVADRSRDVAADFLPAGGQGERRDANNAQPRTFRITPPQNLAEALSRASFLLRNG